MSLCEDVEINQHSNWLWLNEYPFPRAWFHVEASKAHMQSLLWSRADKICRSTGIQHSLRVLVTGVHDVLRSKYIAPICNAGKSRYIITCLLTLSVPYADSFSKQIERNHVGGR